MLEFKKIKSVALIGFFSLHSSFIYASDAGNGEDEMVRLQRDIDSVCGYVRETRGDDPAQPSVIVIGDTGSGKSTLITHLANRPLVAKSLPGRPKFLETEEPLPGFQIGAGIGVGTRMPTAWKDPISNILYWDCPGFHDPRGATTDIVNTFSIQQLFQSPSRVKIVLVAPEPDLEARARNFGNLLNQLTKIFPRNEELTKCLSVVITRQVDATFDTFAAIRDSAELAEFFSAPRVRELLGFLADNAATRVSFLPRPLTEGLYAGNRDAILASFATADYVENPTFHITVPPAAHLYLNQLLNRLDDSMGQTLQQSRGAIVEAFKFSLKGKDLGVVEESVEEGKASLRSIGSPPSRAEDCIALFSSMNLLPTEAREAIVFKLGQIITIQRISDEGAINLNFRRWIDTVQEILSVLDYVGELHIKNLELMNERRRYAEAVAMVAERDRQLATERSAASSALSAKDAQIASERAAASTSLSAKDSQFSASLRDLREMKEKFNNRQGLLRTLYEEALKCISLDHKGMLKYFVRDVLDGHWKDRSPL